MNTTHFTRESLLALFDELKLNYRQTAHDAVYTMAESAALNATLLGCRCKNLLVQNKKGSARFLVVTTPDARVDLGELGRRLDVGRLSFCSPETMQELLGVTPGAASPFALAADTDGRVKLVVDAGLASATHFLFHPLVNTATVSIGWEDLARFLAAVDHPATFVDIPQRVDTAGSDAA